MYGIVFYFFYHIIFYLGEKDRVSTAAILTYVVIWLHILALWILAANIGILPRVPVFSEVYLHNKLYWFIPLSLLLVCLSLIFNKRRKQAWIKKYENERFFSMARVGILIIAIASPIIVFVLFPGKAHGN